MVRRLPQKFGYYALSLLAPLGLMLIIYAKLQIVPFGSHNLLISDLGTQYMPFLAEFKRQLAHLSFSTYSFSVSLGGNLVPLAAYYLISPFNIVLLFWPDSQLPIVVGYVIVAKICTMGLTMSYFLMTRQKAYYYRALLFSTAYSLCGFVAMNFYNLMWLDALILLPLVVLGLERLFARQKPTVYILSLTATILTNYYLGYMTCLLAVIYMISLLIKHAYPDQTWRQFWQKQRRVIGQFIWSSMIAGGLTAVILVPSLLGMLKTGKKAIAVSSFYPTPQFGLGILSQFQVGGSNYAQRLVHGPTLFVGTWVLLLAVLYFMLPTIPKAAKRANAFLIISLGLSFWITTFNTVWHMFQQPEGFPYRNAYLLSFVLIKIAYEASLVTVKPKRVKRLALIIVGICLVLGQAVVYWGPSLKGVQKQPLTLVIGFFLLLGCLLMWTPLTQRSHCLKQGLVVLVTFSELVVNFQLTTNQMPLGNQTTYVKQYQRQAALFQQLDQQTPDFYRVNNQSVLLKNAFQERYYGYNDALLFGQYTLNNYSSTLDEQMRSMLVKLGFYSKNARRINGIGHTAVTDLLFANRYDLLAKGQSTTIQRHQTLGLGFAVNARLQQIKLKAHQPFVNQDAILQAMTGMQTPFYTPNQIISRTVQRTNNRYRYTLTAQIKTSGPSYLYLPHQDLTKVKLLVNGQLKPAPIALNSATVIALGNYQQGQRVTLTVISKRRHKPADFQFTTLNQTAFKQALKILGQQKLTVKRLTQDSSRITGQVQVHKNRQLLYLSIPYDSGWQAVVNHQHVSTTKVMGNMLAVPVKKGQNQVVLTYRAPGLMLGLMISLISWLSWGLISWVTRRQTN